MIPLSFVYVTRENRTGDASIPSRVMKDGRTHAWKPFYYCKGNACSIFNVSIPYERHWLDGIPTTIPNITRGEVFTDAYVREGCEHTEAYAMQHCGVTEQEDIYTELECNGTISCDDLLSCEGLQPPAPQPNVANILMLGQSNNAHHGQGLTHTALQEVYSYDGYEFQRSASPQTAEGPYHLASGNASHFMSLLGDKLVSSTSYDRVNFINVSMGGAYIHQWTPNSGYFERIDDVDSYVFQTGLFERIDNADDFRSEIGDYDYILIHQGESDNTDSTPPAEYVADYKEVIASIKRLGITAPVFVSIATVCQNTASTELQDAQQEVIDTTDNVYQGINTDVLGPEYRYDDCHFNAQGLTLIADEWYTVISEH